MNEIPVLLEKTTNPILGNSPIVIIGPNGVGKTQFGTQLSKLNNADWISAMRYLQLESNIQLMTEDAAKSEFNRTITDTKNNPWRMSSDLQYLLSKIKIDDSNSAVKFRDNFKTNSQSNPDETSLQKLTAFWNSLYPERTIDFSTYRPTVTSNREDKQDNYEIRMMSDGERTALYLAARVIDSESKIIIVDEPEVHFHSLLAKKFWNELERIKENCRFVYITHDLPFAISRRQSVYVILNSSSNYQIIDNINLLPSDLVESILGAASFSFSSNKVLFCEGNYEKSKDYLFYSSYYNSNRIPIIPVGSCDSVKQCVEVFNSNESFKNMKAYGIIDSDFWPNEYFSDMPSEVKKLNVHEIENLFCDQELFSIVSKFLLISEKETAKNYVEAIQNAKNNINKIVFNKYILEKIRKKTEVLFLSKLNSLKPNNLLDVIKSSFIEKVQDSISKINFDEQFNEEEKALNQLLENNTNFAKEYPGKSIISCLSDKIGISTTRYFEIVIMLLKNEDESKNEYVTSLKEYFAKHLPEIEI